MNDIIPIVTIVACFALSLLCVKASRIIENWKQDVRKPVLSDFYGAFLARFGLRYFARHSAVLACLIWLAFAIELVVVGINVILII